MATKREKRQRVIEVDSVQKMDVCCGRGKRYDTHPGNRLFRHLVEKSSIPYSLAKSRATKVKIVKDIVDFLVDKSGCRFIKKLDGDTAKIETEDGNSSVSSEGSKSSIFHPNEKWIDITYEARAKTGHAVRDCVRKLRKNPKHQAYLKTIVTTTLPQKLPVSTPSKLSNGYTTVIASSSSSTFCELNVLPCSGRSSGNGTIAEDPKSNGSTSGVCKFIYPEGCSSLESRFSSSDSIEDLHDNILELNTPTFERNTTSSAIQTALALDEAIREADEAATSFDDELLIPEYQLSLSDIPFQANHLQNLPGNHYNFTSCNPGGTSMNERVNPFELYNESLQVTASKYHKDLLKTSCLSASIDDHDIYLDYIKELSSDDDTTMVVKDFWLAGDDKYSSKNIFIASEDHYRAAALTKRPRWSITNTTSTLQTQL